jgi:hypothetical protein
VPNDTASAGRFDKYRWLRLVLAETDKSLTLGHKAILSYVAIFDVRNGDDTFCARQDTIASHCNVTRATVNAAIGAAKGLGYITVTRRRKTGANQHGADTLRLTLPNDESCQIFLPDSPDWNQESCQRSLHDSVESSKENHLVTSNSLTHIRNTGFNNGSLKEGGTESSQVSLRDSHQPPQCPRHPEGPEHGENCWRCGEVRKWRKQHAADEAAARQDSRRAARAAVEACTICDGTGTVDAGIDEFGNEQVRKCLCKNDAGKAELA